MKISIIVPVYNASKWLRHCFDSILCQDYDDYEVLVVDDGSIDNSGDICDEYANADARFKVVYKPNGGVSSARNVGLDRVSGDYVMFVDSDDALLPGALKSMSEALGDADFLLGGHIVCSKSSSRKSSSADGLIGADSAVSDVVLPDYGQFFNNMSAFWDANLKRNCPMIDAPWGKLFRRSLIGDMRFCEQLSYAEDKLFVFNYLSSCKSAVTLKSPVYEYVVHRGSLGSDTTSDKHLLQLRTFMPLYADVIRRLESICPNSHSIRSLYHNDLVGRYACRILNIFITRKTNLLTNDYICWLYDLMDGDHGLGIFSVRPGQVFNILLYKLGNIKLSIKIYKFISGLMA